MPAPITSSTSSSTVVPPVLRSTPVASGLAVFATRVCLCFALLLRSAVAAPQNAIVMGPEDESKYITITVWLNQHNKAALDALVEQIYDPGSPNYHRFLTMPEYKEQFAPTAKDAAAVRDFLVSHNMSVTSIDQHNHYVVAQARVADAQAAFNTQVNRVMLDGAVHRMTTSEPSVTGEIAPLVAAVQGLSDLNYRAHVTRAIDPETRAPYTGTALTSPGPDGLFFSAD